MNPTVLFYTTIKTGPFAGSEIHLTRLAKGVAVLAGRHSEPMRSLEEVLRTALERECETALGAIDPQWEERER